MKEFIWVHDPKGIRVHEVEGMWLQAASIAPGAASKMHISTMSRKQREQPGNARVFKLSKPTSRPYASNKATPLRLP